MPSRSSAATAGAGWRTRWRRRACAATACLAPARRGSACRSATAARSPSSTSGAARSTRRIGPRSRRRSRGSPPARPGSGWRARSRRALRSTVPRGCCAWPARPARAWRWTSAASTLRLALAEGPDFVKVNARRGGRDRRRSDAAGLRERAGSERRRDHPRRGGMELVNRPAARSSARPRRASAPTRSAAATRVGRLPRGARQRRPHGPRRSTARDAGGGGVTRRCRGPAASAEPGLNAPLPFPPPAGRAPALGCEEVQVAVVDRGSRRSPVCTSTRPRTRGRQARPRVVGEQAAVVGADLLHLDRGCVDAERHECLVAERLDDLGLDLHARSRVSSTGPASSNAPGAQPEHDVATACRRDSAPAAARSPANATRSPSHARARPGSSSASR